MLYLVSVDGGPRAGTCKIGFTAAPGLRTVGLTAHVKGAVTLVAVAPGTRTDERRMHDALAASRVLFGTEREFFERAAAMAAFGDVRGFTPIGLRAEVNDGAPRAELLALDTNDERARSIACGHLIRSLRLAAGLSLREAASLVRVTHSTWRKWEGGATPNVVSALRIAEVLGVPFDAIWSSAASEASS